MQDHDTQPNQAHKPIVLGDGQTTILAENPIFQILQVHLSGQHEQSHGGSAHDYIVIKNISDNEISPLHSLRIFAFDHATDAILSSDGTANFDGSLDYSAILPGESRIVVFTAFTDYRIGCHDFTIRIVYDDIHRLEYSKSDVCPMAETSTTTANITGAPNLVASSQTPAHTNAISQELVRQAYEAYISGEEITDTDLEEVLSAIDAPAVGLTPEEESLNASFSPVVFLLLLLPFFVCMILMFARRRQSDKSSAVVIEKELEDNAGL